MGRRTTSSHLERTGSDKVRLLPGALKWSESACGRCCRSFGLSRCVSVEYVYGFQSTIPLRRLSGIVDWKPYTYSTLTHRESPNDLQQRPHALSDHLRAPGSKRTLSLPVRSRCDEVVRRPMTKSVPLDAPLDGDRHTGALRAQSVAHRDSDFCATVFAAFQASNAIDL